MIQRHGENLIPKQTVIDGFLFQVKCDEAKPTCTQCRRGNRTCAWAGSKERRIRQVRRANATACDYCKEKKVCRCNPAMKRPANLICCVAWQLKCVGDVQAACEKCRDLGLICARSQASTYAEPQISLAGSISDLTSTTTASTPTHWSTHSIPPNPSQISGTDAECLSRYPGRHTQSKESTQSGREAPGTLLGQLPRGKELEDLVQIYFSSVHGQYRVLFPGFAWHAHSLIVLPIRLWLLRIYPSAPLQSSPRSRQSSSGTDFYDAS